MEDKRFELQKSDGKTCAQVLVYDEDDLQYWTKQAKETGYLMAFDCHIPEDAMGYPDPPHDIYQIFPPEQEEKVYLRMRQPNKPFWLPD